MNDKFRNAVCGGRLINFKSEQVFLKWNSEPEGIHFDLKTFILLVIQYFVLDCESLHKLWIYFC